MAKPRSQPLDFLVYLVVRCLVCVAQMLPARFMLSLAGPLGWLAWKLNKRHRLVAMENVRHAFPAMADDEVDQLVRRCYVHFVGVAIEMAIMPRILHKGNMARHVLEPIPERAAEFRAVTRSGRPVLLLTGHLGNWEVLSHALGMDGLRGAAVARRLDNPWLDRFIKRFRRRTGQELLCKNEDYPRIQQVLASGGMLGLVGDQDAGPRGLFVDFFGRPASTFKAIGLLALEYDAIILVVAALRVGQPIVYEAVPGALIDPRDYADHPDAVRAITQRYTEALEEMTRRAPEQYFWLHRRWKHQPRQRAGLKRPPSSAADGSEAA